MILNILIFWLLFYIWYIIIKTWNPILWWLFILFSFIVGIIYKYNYILIFISFVYITIDYMINYKYKRKKIKEKVNKELKEKKQTEIIKYLI